MDQTKSLGVPKLLKGRARAFYRRNATGLAERGLLTPSDRDSFILLCQCYGRLQDSGEELTIIRYVALLKQVTQLMAKFGLDPQSKRKMGIKATTENKDKFGL